MKVIIGGFTGSGKTTALSIIESRAKLKAFDLDGEFYNSHGVTPGEFIRLEGMEKFRNLEKQVLMNIINAESSFIISLGGGTLQLDVAKELNLKEEIHKFWLNRSFEHCWSSIKSDPHRPIVDLGESECLKLYEERTNIATSYNWNKVSQEELLESLLNLPELT